jgi:hypothetical protein
MLFPAACSPTKTLMEPNTTSARLIGPKFFTFRRGRTSRMGMAMTSLGPRSPRG